MALPIVVAERHRTVHAHIVMACTFMAYIALAYVIMAGMVVALLTSAANTANSRSIYFWQLFGACRRRAPRAGTDRRAAFGEVSARRAFRCVQVDTGPRHYNILVIVI